MHAVHQARVDRRAGDSGDGNEIDGVEFIRFDARARQGAAKSFLAELAGDVDPGVVGDAEGVERVIALHGQRQIAALDADTAKHALDHIGIFKLRRPALFERRGERFLGIILRGEGGCGSGDLHDFDSPYLAGVASGHGAVRTRRGG